MRAMILAAGLGKRMRPLTDHTPKPLLNVGGHYLIEYHLQNLAAAGIKDVVINTHWLAEQLPQKLGKGERWGLNLHYSHEPALLETAGGIRQAVPLLAEENDAHFLLVNGDVFVDWSLETWLHDALSQIGDKQALLALVNNPDHHPQGDFSLDPQTSILQLANEDQTQTYTYSGIGLYRIDLFSPLNPGYAALGPLLKEKILTGSLLGKVHAGYWLDVGTPERLSELENYLQSS